MDQPHQMKGDEVLSTRIAAPIEPVPWPRDLAFVLVLPAALYGIAMIDVALFDLIVNTLSDAYIAVSVFVAITLGGFHLLNVYFQSGISRSLNRQSPWQVPQAAFLGALPGCGGAIIVVTQYVNGRMSFGALVAVLISTMGDAAFLLLSHEPLVAMFVYVISCAAGITTGYVINLVHGYDFMQVNWPADTSEPLTIPSLPEKLVSLFMALLIPGAVFGVLEAFLFEADALFGPLAELEPIKWLGFVGAVICLSIWIGQPVNSWSVRFGRSPDRAGIKETISAETSFVTAWVIAGFLVYELLVYWTGVDLGSYFGRIGAIAPLLAVLIGFIPGCGPQILVTSLYLNGVVPLSCQLANAISNDGDALFPAIALTPGPAVAATLYSAIPAIIIGYVAFAHGL